MKKGTLILLSAILLTGSCKKSEDSSNSCPTPDLDVSAGITGGTAQVDVSSGYGFYEIKYGSNGFTGAGTTRTISDNQYTITNLQAGTYDVYARGNCGGTSWSDWAGPKSFLLQQGPPECEVPSNLRVEGFSFYWDYPSTAQTAEKFEVEWGSTGFSQGHGTLVTVEAPLDGYWDGSYAKGSKYDFYVRANCGGNDWTDWAGPVSFTAPDNLNMCLPPSQINAFTVYNAFSQCVGARFEWNNNGEADWEFTLVWQGDSPNSGNIVAADGSNGVQYGPLDCSYTYDFYVRAICRNGNKSAWSAPKSINP